MFIQTGESSQFPSSRILRPYLFSCHIRRDQIDLKMVSKDEHVKILKENEIKRSLKTKY